MTKEFERNKKIWERILKLNRMPSRGFHNLHSVDAVHVGGNVDGMMDDELYDIITEG